MKRLPSKRHPREVLLTAAQIHRKVAVLAREISRDYTDKELTLVCVLKGSVIFFADLLRRLTIDCAVDFIEVSSYSGTHTSGDVRLVTDLRESPEGRHLLLVEDIVDSGYTLDYLYKNLVTRNPLSVRTCVLLDKEHARKVPVPVDYRGFVIPEAFVVGYGLDHNEAYRGLPYIGILKE